MENLPESTKGNNANTLLSVRCLLDELKSKQTENKGGGMRPIDYDIDCVRRTLELLLKKAMTDKVWLCDVAVPMPIDTRGNIAKPLVVRRLEDIMSKFGEAHNMMARTKLSKEEYQPISSLMATAKVELFNLYYELKNKQDV